MDRFSNSPDEMHWSTGRSQGTNVLEIIVYPKTTKAIITDVIEVRPLIEEISIHEQAEALRNPYTAELLEISENYITRLLPVVGSDAEIALGGSLASRTAVRGRNDIDLKVLLPSGQDSDADIRAVSERIADVVPFKEEFTRVQGDHQQFAHRHRLEAQLDGLDDLVTIDVVVISARGRVGHALQAAQLPEQMLDQYVVYKTDTQNNKAEYKKLKRQFYAMTRWLYSRGYMSEAVNPEEQAALFEEAWVVFWGDDLDEILNK